MSGMEQIKALPAKWREQADSKLAAAESIRDACPEDAFGMDCEAKEAELKADELDTALQSLRDEVGEAVAPFGWVRYHQKHGYTFNLGHEPLGDETGLGWRDVPLYTHPAPAAESAPQGGVAEWWCPECQRVVQPVEVTYSEHHDGCGAQVTARAATPPSAPAPEAP